MKHIISIILILGGFILPLCGQTNDTLKAKKMNTFKIEKTDAEWKKELTSEQYDILRQCGTELPGSGKYNDFYEEGFYECTACGQVLFDSGTKFHSGSGWPSFYDVIEGGKVVLIEDGSYGMLRNEVRCSKCGGHLGHVFNDGPAPTHQRYCINSVALKFVKRQKE
jgi:peptide-methionine (R)-S-oxide reductase